METLIGVAPYSALYQQFMLIVSLAGLAVAAGLWRPRRHGRRTSDVAPTQVLSLTGLFLLRLLPSVAPPTSAWSPPIERIADLAGLALLVWASMPTFRQSRWLGRIWLVINGAVSLAYLGATIVGDPQVALPASHYNISPPAVLWTIWQVLAVVAAMVAAAVGRARPGGTRPETRGLLLIALGTLLIGYDLHLLAIAGVLPHYPPPDNVASWVRCTQILAYPALIGGLYSSFLFTGHQRSEP